MPTLRKTKSPRRSRRRRKSSPRRSRRRRKSPKRSRRRSLPGSGFFGSSKPKPSRQEIQNSERSTRRSIRKHINRPYRRERSATAIQKYWRAKAERKKNAVFHRKQARINRIIAGDTPRQVANRALRQKARARQQEARARQQEAKRERRQVAKRARQEARARQRSSRG